MLIVLLILLESSCSSGVISTGYGIVTVQYAPAAGSRGLADAWPMGGLPVFSSITVGVVDSEGNEVALESEPPSGDSVTLRVQAGTGLRVEFEGVPDWDATALAYPAFADTLPALATGYSGLSDEFSVAAGETATVTVRLAVSATKIVIPNPAGSTNWQLATVDSIDATSLDVGIPLGGLDWTSFKFDRFGTLYLTRDLDGSFAVEAYTSLENSTTITTTSSYLLSGIALDEERDRLYLSNNWDGYVPEYVDLSTEAPTTVGISLPSEQVEYYIDPAMAADSEGYVYATGINSTGDKVLIKMSVGTPSEGNVEAAIASQPTFDSLGLRYSANYDGAGSQNYQLSVQDMAVYDGILYILATDIETPADSGYLVIARSKGKVIAVSTSTMSKLWEAGWVGDGVKYPTSDGTQFYGPTRIVGIAPKKLYIIDEGGVFDSNTYAYLDIDRVVELDTESGSITKVGLEGESSFFTVYSYISIC